MEKKALVLGATGLVGQSLVSKLLQNKAYSEVTIFIRKDLPIEHPKLNKVIVDFDTLQNWKEEFSVDDVFCCLGTTIKKAGSQEAFRKVDFEYPVQAAFLAKEQGVKQYLVISSTGAGSDSPFFYSRVKGELEEKLKAVHFQSLHIFRPSLLLGNRSEFRFGEKVAEYLSAALPFLYAGKMKKYKPIPADLVAEGMITAAVRNESGIQVHESQDVFNMRNK